LTASIHAARDNYNPRVIAALLDRSAGIHAKDEDYWAELMSAAIDNTNPDVLALLLERIAGIHAKDGSGER
jgi:ankyrin repeat protein